MSPLRSILLLSLFALLKAQDGPNDTGALPDSVADGVDNPIIASPRPSIYEYITNSGQHNILSALVGLVEDLPARLNAPGGRFTLLAPVDEAFRQLLRDNNIQFMNDDDVIKELGGVVSSLSVIPGFPGVDGILQYHTIGRPATYEMLVENRTVATTSGQNLIFTENSIRDKDPSRGDSSVQQRNIFATNGWIHVHSSLLLPRNLRKALEEVANMPTPTVTPAASPSADSVPDTVGPDTDSDTDSDSDSGAATDGEDVDGTSEASPEASEEDNSVCFPASSTVRLASGKAIRMDELEAGHEIALHEGASPVFLFTHRTSKPMVKMVRLTTRSGHSVTMTGSHYIYRDGALGTARSVKIGENLHTSSGKSPVVSIEHVEERGLYAPHTVHGDLVVDGVLVSGYSRTLNPRVAHAILAPVRAFVKWTGVVEPLGGLLYEGADRVAAIVPRGGEVY